MYLLAKYDSDRFYSGGDVNLWTRHLNPPYLEILKIGNTSLQLGSPKTFSLGNKTKYNFWMLSLTSKHTNLGFILKTWDCFSPNWKTFRWVKKQRLSWCRYGSFCNIQWHLLSYLSGHTLRHEYKGAIFSEKGKTRQKVRKCTKIYKN